MSEFGKRLILSAVVPFYQLPAFAPPKGDAGSGPTSGSTSTNDAGSGPTKGAKPELRNSTATSNSNGSTENSAGVTPGPKSTGGSQPVTPAMPEKKQ